MTLTKDLTGPFFLVTEGEYSLLVLRSFTIEPIK